jgi:alkylresorcinol/alkylpyrone synthase
MLATPAPVLQAVSRVLPRHYWPQEQLISYFSELWRKKLGHIERLKDLHRSVQVKGRYMALPVDELDSLDTFAKRNSAFIRCATELGERAISQVLAQAGLTPKDIDHIFFVTITGLATPSIDALLVNRLGLRPDVKRTPIWGLGCLAGAAGIARAADYLRGFPDSTAVLLSVELCSLTLQKEDLSVPNIIASGLFGDGAAAVLLQGGKRADAAGPRVLASRSSFYANTERVMGWEICDSGFKIVLSAKVPEMVNEHFGSDVDGFLSSHGLDRQSIKHWLLHTGGPKVLKAIESTLQLQPSALHRTWASLQEVGNLSSASVLFVLGDFMESEEPQTGDHGLLAAMGPGFCAELVLLQW